MKYLFRTVRKYPLTTLAVIAVWYLSFFTPPKTKLDNVAFIDKWIHMVMYGGTCAVLWAEYLARHRRIASPARLALTVWAAPLMMSGTIELLQEYCTGGRRSGDWLDLAANATGVTLAALIGILAARFRSKGGTGCA